MPEMCSVSARPCPRRSGRPQEVVGCLRSVAAEERHELNIQRHSSGGWADQLRPHSTRGRPCGVEPGRSHRCVAWARFFESLGCRADRLLRVVLLRSDESVLLPQSWHGGRAERTLIKRVVSSAGSQPPVAAVRVAAGVRPEARRPRHRDGHARPGAGIQPERSGRRRRLELGSQWLAMP